MNTKELKQLCKDYNDYVVKGSDRDREGFYIELLEYALDDIRYFNHLIEEMQDELDMLDL